MISTLHRCVCAFAFSISIVGCGVQTWEVTEKDGTKQIYSVVRNPNYAFALLDYNYNVDSSGEGAASSKVSTAGW